MLASLEKRLAQTGEKLRTLTIMAPCDGVVIAPPQVSPQPADLLDASLPRWNGTPLEVAEPRLLAGDAIAFVERRS